MAKFRFKFEAVEEVRKKAQDDALRVFAQAQQSVQAAVRHKERLLGELNGALARRERLGEAPASGVDFQLENAFILGTKQRIVQADQAIVRANRNLSKAMQAYLQARKAAKILETLREKSLSEFKLVQKKRELRQQDELYLMRARMTALSDLESSERGEEASA